MKISNWTRKIRASVFAVGLLVPSASYAANIPLGDPSFEAYMVPAIGYAYSNEYRPTSAWVDDLDSPPDGVGGPSGYYVQDDGDSNWLYNAAYAAASADGRPIPRTGSQAMHGLGYYNAQETGAVFEAGMTYTFSIWQQVDRNFVASRNGTWMYIFDGSVPFSEANSLAFAAPIPALTGVWTQVSVSHTVLPGAAEIGKSVGVAFLPRSDTAVDDASLDVVPEPTALALAGLGGVGLWAFRRRRE
jgi:hypothetical protein